MDGRCPRGARLAFASSRKNVLRALSLLTAVLLGVGFVAAVGPSETEAKPYSAYSDPTKTALSFVLSDEGNLGDFREEFGLDDGEVEEVLAAVREENEKLAGEYAESERLIASKKKLSEGRIAAEVNASDYDEKVRAAIAATKDVVESVVPEDRRADLEAWVDERWLGEVEEAQSLEGPQAVQDRAATSRARRGITCRVYATQYIGHTRYEVAVPHRAIKFAGGYRVGIIRLNQERRAWAPVKEVGPWNTYDNYWAARADRTMWKDLDRCVPEARAAYYNNYNRGEDEYGREVLNPAGVDLTPAVAREVGLDRYQNAWVYVRFPWVRR